MSSVVLSWGGNASLALDGVSLAQAAGIASRWRASVDAEDIRSGGVEHRLEVPYGFLEPVDRRVNRRAPTVVARVRDGLVEVRVGRHRIHLDSTGGGDRISVSSGCGLDDSERESLVGVAISHLLALQGLPVLHSCAFDLGEVSILGLGESFSGKTTVSVAAMRAGGRVVSDDAVLVVPVSGGGHSLVPIRSHGWLRGRTREIVPGELREKMVENEENGQPRWVLNREDGGAGFVESATPNVIWIQSVDRRLKESRVEPVDQGQVFAALIRASSPLYLSRHCPEIRDKLIPVFRSLCAQCRGFRVRLSPRLLEAPEQEMRRLLDLSRGGLSDGELNYEL